MVAAAFPPTPPSRAEQPDAASPGNCIESVNPDGSGRQVAVPCSRGRRSHGPDGRKLLYETAQEAIEYVTDGANPGRRRLGNKRPWRLQLVA